MKWLLIIFVFQHTVSLGLFANNAHAMRIPKTKVRYSVGVGRKPMLEICPSYPARQANRDFHTKLNNNGDLI